MDSDLIKAFVASMPEHTRRAGSGFADSLRRELPDLDDLTIGRFLSLMTSFVAGIAQGYADAEHGRLAALDGLGEVLTCAALDLAATEWEVDDAPSS
jgi:hypothetical protein